MNLKTPWSLFTQCLISLSILSARLKPVPAPTSSALMHSDSDLDSDEAPGPWTEQERGQLLRPQNGSLRNGQGPARAKKQQREELL